MKEMNIPVGVSDFEEIRKNGYYYIDKSGLIGELLSRTGTKVTLITRPRRFGKTLGMSMLENFFDIRKDSRKLFEGLEITENQALCVEWMKTTLAVIYDLSYLTFDMSLDELDVNQVEVGQTVEVTCDSLEDVGTIEGVVTKVSVAGTTSNGVTTYPVTVQIDNPPEDLLPGMNVDAVIVVDEATDVIAVPISAVQRGDIVYVKDDTVTNTDGTMADSPPHHTGHRPFRTRPPGLS